MLVFRCMRCWSSWYGSRCNQHKAFLKNDVLFDYHGLESQPNESVERYCSLDPINRKPEYIIDVKQGKQPVIDASIDPCSIHKGHRCLARLANHAPEFLDGRYNINCNMQLTEIACNQLASAKSCQRIVVLKARRNIDPLEQLLWDYKDGEARRQLTGRPSSSWNKPS